MRELWREWIPSPADPADPSSYHLELLTIADSDG